MFSKNLTFEETLETTAQINEELKREFDGAAFCKKKNHLISLIMFSLKVRRKSVEKIGHQSIGVTERPRSLMLYHCSFSYLARASMDDVACEFACLVRMRGNN